MIHQYQGAKAAIVLLLIAKLTSPSPFASTKDSREAHLETNVDSQGYPRDTSEAVAVAILPDIDMGKFNSLLDTE